MKKVTRGIIEDFADEFIKSDLYKFYLQNKHELIIGVRNNYLNLYYNCDSIAKVKFTRGSVCCEIDKYYLDGKHYSRKDKEKRYKVDESQIRKQYKEIKKHSYNKVTPEKKAQSELVLLNNQNQNSNWYCLDVEYVKSFKNQSEKDKANFNGRFDIIAIHKENPHRIALIELKYGSGAIGGKSGIYKHVSDFTKFCDLNFYDGHLKHEIIEILKTLKYLKIPLPFNLPDKNELLPPEFYFITLDNNAKSAKGSTPKQTMAGYLFENKKWDCKKLSTKPSVEANFGDITKKNNKFQATFLFSKATLKNIKITDIIDGDYDERIIPV